MSASLPQNPGCRAAARRPSTPPHRRDRGVVLMLTVFVLVIFIVLILDLRFASMVGMQVARNETESVQRLYAARAGLERARQVLLDDVESEGGETGSGSEGGDDAGGAGGFNLSGGAATGGGAAVDTLLDAWASPLETEEGEIRVTVVIEDENRKWNLLSFLEEDPQEVTAQKETLARILDLQWEGMEDDASFGDGMGIADALLAYLSTLAGPPGPDTPRLGTIALLSPRELLRIPEVPERWLRDRVIWDGTEPSRIDPGLERYVTVWTSLRLGALPEAEEEGGVPPPGGGDGGDGGDEGTGAGASPTSLGLVNLNTAPEVVLASLLPPDEMPPSVAREIVAYRTEFLEKAQEEQQDPFAPGSQGDEGGDEEENVADGVFESVEDLESEDLAPYLSLYQSLPEETRTKFKSLIGTQSDVFSIWILTERADRRRCFRQVVWRTEGETGMQIVPVVPWEVVSRPPASLFPPRAPGEETEDLSSFFGS